MANDTDPPPTSQSLSSEVPAALGNNAAGQTPLKTRPDWLSYAATPSGPGLAALIARTPLEERGSLVDVIEVLFFEREDWRVAQHTAMLHLDRFEPHSQQADLVKALCFAEYACLRSKDDPRARLVMGRVSWERRLPLAVFHDVETARAGEARLRAETSEVVVQKVLAEAFLLEGLARAYLRDVGRAHESLAQADRLGGLTVEAVHQLLIVAEPDFHEASMWAASRIPDGIVFGGRPGFLQHRAHRRRLLWLLHGRGANV